MGSVTTVAQSLGVAYAAGINLPATVAVLGIADRAGSASSLMQQQDVIRAIGQTLARNSEAANNLPAAPNGGKAINDQNFAVRTETDRNQPGKPRQI